MDDINPNLIEKLLEGGESETVEFKESFDDEAIETVAAFANARGGTLLIGATDAGAAKGTMTGKESIRDWANKISQATHVNPRIREVSFQGKPIVVIEVAASAARPHPAKGKYFIRIGKSNRQMTEDDLSRAILAKVGSSWDAVPEPRATMADIDPVQMKRFRDLCNEKGRRPIPSKETNEVVLQKLELMKNDLLTRAAVLLFGKDPQRFYHSALVRIGRFRPGNLIVDDKEFLGPLFDQVEGAMSYFREHLQTEYRFTGEPAREVIWEYPLEALREAVTNSVCHRDYASTAQTQIRWFDEELLIMNPGGLPPNLSIQDLKHKHESRPRNQMIARMFFYAGWIEQWGGGTVKILQECKAAKLPEPRFEEKQGGFWLTFPKGALPKPVPTVEIDESLRALGLTDRQIAVVRRVKEKGRITNSEYQNFYKVGKRYASEELASLVDKGILEKIGKTGKGTYYRLKTGRGAKGALKGSQRGTKGAVKGPRGRKK